MGAAPAKGFEEEFAFRLVNGFEITPAVGAAAAAAKGLFIVAPLLVESCPPKVAPLLDEGTPKAFVALFGELKAKAPADC